MTSFALCNPTKDLWLAACYDPTGDGIRITDRVEDACHYVTIDKAASVARELVACLGYEPVIQEVR